MDTCVQRSVWGEGKKLGMYSLETPQIQICAKIFVHDFMKQGLV